jgi:hypothetical protein
MQQLTLSEKLSTMTKLELRDLILYFESQILKLPQTEIPVEHFFASGVYTRQATFAADTLAVGKIHKTRHTNVILKGKFKLITEDGVKEVVGPCVFVSEPGTKKMAYFIEDTIWLNIHATSETDIEKIENAVIAKNYAEIGLDQRELLE